MCVALPGSVISVHGHEAVVDFSGNKVKAQSGLLDIKPGDQVLVHAGCIIQKVSMKEADELNELFQELTALEC